MNEPKLNCILLIDDDPICNFINRKIIEYMEIAHEVKITCNGKEALEFISLYYCKHESFPELILLDLKMPVMDGVSFLENLRFISAYSQASPNLFILTTSGHPLNRKKVEHLVRSNFHIKPLSEKKIREMYIGCLNCKQGTHKEPSDDIRDQGNKR